MPRVRIDRLRPVAEFVETLSNTQLDLLEKCVDAAVYATLKELAHASLGEVRALQGFAEAFGQLGATANARRAGARVQKTEPHSYT